ncbi:hypothetical protein ZIOFF_042061 [Zingiber officinale]|uniref:Myb/SANT-like domain-containing protein n=1 Tax=Zingiber officinale TaxID=94328 RepID=A0A8J5GJR3_ZINOF|nr:hypothetical protein ZIOFF_042061 [Zingiber officinale]
MMVSVLGLGCYYLVDTGYCNLDGFLAPYRGHRYHLNEWEGRRSETAEEYFNMKHSRTRNVIERCFGLLKGRCHDPQECILDEDEQSEEDDSDRGTETEYICIIAPTDQWTAFRNNLAQQMMESNPEEFVGKNVARGRDEGFKNNYMVEIRKIMIQKLPTFTKSVSHIESRIKTLKRKFHAINEMCRKNDCTWNDVEKKIACEETWYLEWIKLEMIYGKDRATGLVAEDPMMAAQNITDVDAGLTISDDKSLAEKGVEVDSMPNQQPSITSRASHSKEKKKSSVDRVQKVSKRAKTLAVQNVDSDFKLLSAQNKYKAAQVICEDPLKVKLLFSSDPSEVEEFILSCLE